MVVNIFIMPLQKIYFNIEVLNNYWHEIPNSDSFIFSDYPLKFLIMRPVYTENQRLYYIGEKSFIKNACKGDCWEFY